MPIRLVITDLDNTLFDWLDIWYRSFSAMLETLVRDSGIERARLIGEIRSIHQRHGTSEYAFLVEELPSLRGLHPRDEDLAARYVAAIDAYRQARTASLRLYPGVRETLCTLRARGCLLVGYTESLAFYTGYRMRKLGLDLLLDHLYSPSDHALPRGLMPEQIRRYPREHYQFRHTVHHDLPAGTHKPDPEVLKAIISNLGGVPAETVYVGDSLLKDVAMAQDAGVPDVHARYGVAQDRAAYDFLREVTHWTDADVERERRLLSRGQIVPAHVLACGFEELLDHFEFAAFPQVALAS